ncbi:MAG: ligand-binding SRPBCC domain-containing protein [bacterium]|jgi:ligand-binding SRPBCC domain-containing protein
MGFYQKKHSQHFNSSIDELWDFISSPTNLKLITPDYMGFDIVSKDLPDKIYEGMIISYKVSPLLGIKTTWVTEITHINDKHYFVDEQRVGPYKIWHHQHFLESTSKGTLMKDIVSYKPPFGILGKIANQLIIKNKLDEIFSYRATVLKELFEESGN